MSNQVPIREGLFETGPDGIQLIGNKCSSCSQLFFPKVTICLNCFSENLQEVRLSKKGYLYSYTIGHMPSTHFSPPYAVGYIDLPEGVRIFAPLKIFEEKPFEVGMEMEAVLENLWEDEEGKEVLGYLFTPS